MQRCVLASHPLASLNRSFKNVKTDIFFLDWRFLIIGTIAMRPGAAVWVYAKSNT